MVATSLQTYSFTLVLAGVDEPTLDMGEAIYAAVDDASLWSEGPVVYLSFDREAATLGDAVGSAIKDAEKAGFKVARVEIEAS